MDLHFSSGYKLMLTSVTKNLLQNCSADAAEQTDGADQWLAIYLKCHSLTAVCLCSVTCHSTYLCCGLYCPSLPFQLLPCLFTPQYQSTYPHKPNPLAAANFTPLPFRWLFGKKKSPCFPTPPPSVTPTSLKLVAGSSSSPSHRLQLPTDLSEWREGGWLVKHVYQPPSTPERIQ